MDANNNSESKEGIKAFYGYYSLEESQKFLWQLFKMAFIGKNKQVTSKEKADLIVFYENLDSFLQESFQENQRNNLSRKCSKLSSVGSKLFHTSSILENIK